MTSIKRTRTLRMHFERTTVIECIPNPWRTRFHAFVRSERVLASFASTWASHYYSLLHKKKTIEGSSICYDLMEPNENPIYFETKTVPDPMTSNPHPIQPATDGSTLARGSDRIGLQDSIISSSWWWTKKFFLYYILLYGMNPHRRKLHWRNADRRNSANYDLTICNFDDLSFLGCHFRRSSYLSVYVFIYIYSECGRWSPKMKIADIDYRTKFGDLYVDCVSFDDVHFGDLSFRWCSFRREFRWSPPSVISTFGDLVFGDEAHSQHESRNWLTLD
jgi:hypothetical protein